MLARLRRLMSPTCAHHALYSTFWGIGGAFSFDGIQEFSHLCPTLQSMLALHGNGIINAPLYGVLIPPLAQAPGLSLECTVICHGKC